MKSKKIGYSFWGFLGDEKFDSEGNKISTPDGNAFYSWSIINEFLLRGYDVTCLMPDRDKPGYNLLGEHLFYSWCTDKRNFAYSNSNHIDYTEYGDICSMSNCDLVSIWDSLGVDEFDFIIHEWRMEIPGRNDIDSRGNKGWQPDLFIQKLLLSYAYVKNIPVIIFDLDYKFDIKDIPSLNNVHVFELGRKFENVACCSKVYIPFDFSSIDEFYIKDLRFLPQANNLVYIGNRYERDWCIDKYIPTEIDGVIVYGNWKESGRDSEDRWPNIKFGHRLQTFEMKGVYSNSIATILLAKKEYCENQFMTARLIEAIFYGTVPLFIEEYGKDCIKEYAGVYANFLTVKSKADVIDRVYRLKYDISLRSSIIQYLRLRLSFMDVKNFVDKCEKVVEECF